MKKLLILSLILGTLAMIVPAAEAANSASAVEQRVEYIGPPQREHRRYRRAYSVVRTRTIRIGFRWYRERYRITYLPNGRTRIRVISRFRIR